MKNLKDRTKMMFSKVKREGEKRLRNNKACTQPPIIPLSKEKYLDECNKMRSEMLTGDRISYPRPSDEGKPFVVDGERQISPVYPLHAGYFKAICLGIIELPDGESFILIFDPYDSEGWRHTEICLTVQKKIRASEALGELLFALGPHDGMHSDSSLVIDNVAAFREMFEDKKVGIEVCENTQTGLLYVTDFFNLTDEAEFPNCPDDIVRNVF